MADINERKKTWKLRAEIAVGATAAVPKYAAQIDWLQPFFLKYAESDGFVGTTTSTGDSSFTGERTGPTAEEEAMALRQLIEELNASLEGSTAAPAAHGMRWASRTCES